MANFPPAPWLEYRARLCAQDGLRGLAGAGSMIGPGQGTLQRLQAARGMLTASLACLESSWPREERCCPPAYVHVGAGTRMIAAGRDLLGRLSSPPTGQAARDQLWAETSRWFATTRAEALRAGAARAAACLPTSMVWADGPTMMPISPGPGPSTRPDPVGAWDAPPADITAPARSSGWVWGVGIASVLALGALGYFVLR